MYNFLTITKSKIGWRSQTIIQEEGGRWLKKFTFCKLLYHRKCKQRWVGGQKKTNLVIVVCERPLIQSENRGKEI